VVIFVQADSGGKTQRKQRPFDFTKYNTRHVALKIAYLGWDYQVDLSLIGKHCAGTHKFILTSRNGSLVLYCHWFM